MQIYMIFMVLFYFITFTPKCSALAVAAVSAELGLRTATKSAQFYNYFCAALLILRTKRPILRSQDHKILSSVNKG